MSRCSTSINIRISTIYRKRSWKISHKQTTLRNWRSTWLTMTVSSLLSQLSQRKNVATFHLLRQVRGDLVQLEMRVSPPVQYPSGSNFAECSRFPLTRIMHWIWGITHPTWPPTTLTTHPISMSKYLLFSLPRTALRSRSSDGHIEISNRHMCLWNRTTESSGLTQICTRFLCWRSMRKFGSLWWNVHFSR